MVNRWRKYLYNNRVGILWQENYKETIEATTEELETVFSLRKTMSNMSAQEMTEQLIEQIVTTKSNEEFLERMKIFFKRI